MGSCPRCRATIAEETRFCPYCGAQASADSIPCDPNVGSVVNGKFRIEALLGQGGMGRVYRAHHLTLDRPVVLKMLHRGFSSDPAVAQRFHREAKAASRLNHPNSIAVLDFGQSEDGTLFMALELLGGKDLARVIAEEFPLSEARIVRIGSQILSALAEAHAQGIVHRDLKPENVMIEQRRDEPDFVKVLDFGIAKISDPGEGERLTQAGLIFGTLEYMSPEQAQGREPDARADLYSVGVILYQMLTGHLPFKSDTPVGYLTKHVSEIPIAPRSRRIDLAISPRLDALVVRALAKDPAARPASAEEMRRELLAALEPGTAPRLGAPTRPIAALGVGTALDAPAPRRRSRVPLVLAALVLAAAGAAGVVALRLKQAVPIEPMPQGHWVDRGGTAVWISTPVPSATAEPFPSGSAGSRPTAGQAPLRARALALCEGAEAKRAEHDIDGAIRLYLAAEVADPTLHMVQKRLALCYQLKGDKRRAAERYRRYLKTGPEDADEVRAILAKLP